MQNMYQDTPHQKPSILELMVENPERVKDTIDLLKIEVAAQNKQIVSVSRDEETARQFTSLSHLLSDTRVREMVNDIVGENVVTVIDRTLGTIDSSCSTKVKREAFKEGIQTVYTNLRNYDILKKNPSAHQSLGFAASLIGLDKEKLKSLQSSATRNPGY